MKQSLVLFSILLLLNGFSSCDSGQQQIKDVIVKDSVTVVCDPSWEPIIRSFQHIYEALNPHRAVTVIVKPEAECVHDLLSKKYKTVFVSRNFTDEEQKLIQRNEWVIKNDSLCYDGLAWIVPKSFPADSLSVSEIKQLFTSGTLNGTAYSIQLNSSGSSVANYLTEYFGIPPSSGHIYKGGSDEDMLKQVSTNNHAIACISSFWLVDMEQQSHRNYLASVKLLKIIQPGNSKAYSPFQDDIAMGVYPFKRVLRVLNNDANTGLGTAFVSFLISDRGQRLFLKSGLLPYKMPGREIELKIQH